MVVGFRRGGLPRPRSGGLLLVASLGTAMVLSACGGTKGGAATTPTTSANFDDNASVTFAGSLVGQDLDPYKAGGTVEGVIDIYDPLIRPQVDLTTKPSLATEWSWSPDNLKLTLKLRQGVTFSDGTPFDSSAVVASVNRARSGSTSLQKNSLASITDVKADGTDKAVITVSRPDPTLVSVLSSPAGSIINPKMIDNQDAILKGAKGVGTGPYVVEKFQPSTVVVLTKRTDYWDQDSIKHAPAKFTYQYTLDGNARLNGLKSGEYQGVQSTGTPGLNGPGGLPQVDKSFADTRVPGFSTMGMSFAFKPPFEKVEVRQAVSHAINFASLVPSVLDDEMNCDATPVSQLSRPDQIGYNPDAKLPAYDLNLAKQLMTQAGYPDGKGFPAVTITSTTASKDVVAAQAFQPELAKIGIQMAINEQPSRVYTVAQLTAGKAQMITTNLTNGGGIDPALGYNTGILAPPTYVDVASAAGKQYQSLVQQAALEPSTEKRTGLYRQAETLAADNAFYIPFCRLKNGFAHTVKVAGFDKDFWILYGAVKASAVTVTK